MRERDFDAIASIVGRIARIAQTTKPMEFGGDREAILLRRIVKRHGGVQ
jgi:hypothetical protein